MKHLYALALLVSLGLPAVTFAQPPCLTSFTAPTGQSAVANASFAATTVPPTTSVNLTMTTTAGSNLVTISGCNAALITNLAPVSGPNVPAGTNISGGACGTNTVQLSLPATVTGSGLHTFTMPGYALNYPPTGGGTPTGLNCSICPSIFTAPACAGQYVNYYMCSGNTYTISMCGSAVTWDSYLAVTTTAGTTLATGFPTSDDDGCGAAGGHALLAFTPTASGLYRIRLWQDPCTVNASNCGTIQIACNPVPPPPANDNPAGAISLGNPLSNACNSVNGTTTFATQTSVGGTPSGCSATCGGSASASFSGVDVWYSAVVGPLGTLSVILDEISATNLAMAVYTGTPTLLTQVGTSCTCENFVSLSGLTPGSTVYIRVWPQSGLPNMGTFSICAYEPVPPPNDNPCGAVNLAVGATCTPQTFSTQNATALSGPVVSPTAPTCGTPVAGGDVWYTVTIPATGSLTVNTTAGTLTDMAMAAYTLTGACGSGTLTEVACNNDNGASTMPRLVLTGAPGTVYYVRVWNRTTAFGTFQICAFQNNPPSNDNPCGATPLTVNPGCLFGGFQTNENATLTPNTLSGQHSSISAVTCGAPVVNDVWFTAFVPSNGVLQLDTDNGQLSDAAFAVYTATGSCGAGTLALTQVPASCQVGGSTNGASMPAGQITGLTPGSTVYIRVWRQSGIDGTFQICARTTVPPAGNCSYTLRLTDLAGDGWNGSFVTVCVGAPCTNYTLNGATSNITIGANFGQIITVSYTAVGGFQNQIAYQLLSNTGGLIYGSTSPPTPGINTNFVVDALCNVPPAPPSDCVGALPVCDTQVINQNPNNTGGVVDLNASNRGCLSANERQGVWFRFQAQTSGQLAFTVAPPSPTDYDWAMWGPFNGGVTCPPPSPPIRCSWSGISGPTGLSYTALDLSEGAGGDGWVRYLDVTPGQWYLLYVDNYSMNGVNFTLQWNNTPSNILDCTIILPVEMLSLDAKAAEDLINVLWSTASEQDASHFVVERSGDGVAFEPIGQLSAAGNSQVINSYEFPDQRPLNGTNYYRLKTVDIDGTTGHTPVVMAEFRRGSIPLQLYPNPANTSINASFVLATEGAVRWRILDMSGRLLQQATLAGTQGSNRVEVPLMQVEAGSYLFEVVDRSGVMLANMRFVKQ
jgi:hypothetical protein